MRNLHNFTKMNNYDIIELSNAKKNMEVLYMYGNGNYNRKADFGEKRYYLQGDLTQKSIVMEKAELLGIITWNEGGTPYVTSKEEFNRLKNYLVEERVPGWWHYVSDEEFLKLCEE